MTRKQAKELLPIIQAFAEGKTIQIKWNNNEWVDIEKDDTLSLVRILECRSNFRIKPEPEYRPFKNAKECWDEMRKHRPVGWVSSINEERYTIFCNIDGNCDFQADFEDYNFADGTPFGVIK